jgi:hypothetical protein
MPVLRIAAETILPAGMVTETPLTNSVTVSDMHGLLCHACGQVRRYGNFRFAIHDLRREQFRRAE